MRCPCDSGKLFAECHGLVDGVKHDDPRDNDKPLCIVEMETREGQPYKVVGTHANQVQEEARKAFLWLKSR